MYLTKLPNLIGVQSQAFDPETYDPGMEQEEFGQSVFNLLRWRYIKDNDDSEEYKRDADGKLIRESNSRLVEWVKAGLSLWEQYLMNFHKSFLITFCLPQKVD